MVSHSVSCVAYSLSLESLEMNRNPYRITESTRSIYTRLLFSHAGGFQVAWLTPSVRLRDCFGRAGYSSAVVKVRNCSGIIVLRPQRVLHRTSIHPGSVVGGWGIPASGQWNGRFKDLLCDGDINWVFVGDVYFAVRDRRFGSMGVYRRHNRLGLRRASRAMEVGYGNLTTCTARNPHWRPRFQIRCVFDDMNKCPRPTS